MIRWGARMPFRVAAHAVVGAGIRAAAGGRQCRDLHRLRRLPAARPGPKGSHRRRDRTGIVHRRRRHPSASAAQGGARRGRVRRHLRPDSVGRWRRCGWRRRRSGDLPALVGPEQRAGRLRRTRAARVPRRRRTARPRGRAPNRDRWPALRGLVGLFRDGIDAHLARLAWVLGSCGWRVS